MANDAAFNTTVAARTRGARFILSTPDLLAAYEARGGLAADLEAIVRHGADAEAANLAQSGRLADGSAASLDVTRAFAALQREYKAVMAVVRAVKLDLEQAGAPTALIERVGQILVDETAAVVRISTKDGTIERKMQRSESQEALRAEIHKDASALLALADLTEPLARRRVDAARLTALRDAAAELAGQLAVRTAKKSERKHATEAESSAVRAQRKVWGACYRLLSSIDDPRMRALLKDARR